jgi:hypothetical protein
LLWFGLAASAGGQGRAGRLESPHYFGKVSLPGLAIKENRMELSNHVLADLFRQLGLPDDHAGIETFITGHRPLPGATRLADAPFWSPAQATFLREEITEDADWAELVDQLNAALRGA